MTIFANKETVAQRLSFCKTCEYKANFLMTSKCSLCKCIIPAKVVVQEAKCPIDKW
jgi:hypothetical protein